MSSYSIVGILTQFAFVVPPVIAYIVGLVLAMQRRSSHPYSAGLATWGFLVLLLETLFFTCVRTVLIFQRPNAGMSPSTYSNLFGLMALFQAVFFTLGLGLLIAAIFSDRGSAATARRRPEPDDFDAPRQRQPRETPRSETANASDAYREKRE